MFRNKMRHAAAPASGAPAMSWRPRALPANSLRANGPADFVHDPGEAGAFIAGHSTAPGSKLPLNTNGRGLSYMHSGMYSTYALQESVRRMRGIAPTQIPGAKISVRYGVGGIFAASGTIIMSNTPA
jgi:hypothetical protein